MDRKRPSSSATMERKIVEKNRRNQMKDLFSILFSLLPGRNSKEPVPLQDQIVEATNYIKSLQKKVTELNERKENLTSGKQYSTRNAIAPSTSSSSISPKLEIHEMGSSMNLILTTGFDNHCMFREIICILHEESADVVNASFSFSQNMVIHVIHAEMGDSAFGAKAARISQRISNFVHGNTSEKLLVPEPEPGLELGFWDF